MTCAPGACGSGPPARTSAQPRPPGAARCARSTTRPRPRPPARSVCRSPGSRPHRSIAPIASATTPATVAATAATAGRRTTPVPGGVAHGEARGKGQPPRDPAQLRDGDRDQQHHAEYGGDGRCGDVGLAPDLTRTMDCTGDAEPEQQRTDQRRAKPRASLAPASGEHGDDVVPRGEHGGCKCGKHRTHEPTRGDGRDVAGRQLERTEPLGAEVLHYGAGEPRDGDTAGRADDRRRRPEHETTREHDPADVGWLTSRGG